ncbi:MAG: 50S ribosomal protein L22 [bacterium]|nr:50S ribosomal protein L22 [Candidatus Jorgensenbacteria bacterium]
METIVAKLKFMKMSPRKVRIYANIIKGLSVNEAEGQLLLSPHRTRDYLLRLLRSAIANATHNKKLDIDTLYVSNVIVDNGPMTKRWTPRARGSASQIQKKTSHITIELGVREAKAKRFTIIAKKKKEEKPKKKKTTSKDSKHTHEDKTVSVEKPKEKRSGGPKIFSRKAI